MSAQNWKFALVIVLILFLLLSFFWLEKRENLKIRLAKYSLPFVLGVLTAGYIMIFPPSLLSYGVVFFSSIGFYFFSSRLKIPLPFRVREEVTYYWLDIVIFWVVFLNFLVVYYFFFYLLNLGEFWRFFIFSVFLMAMSFYLIFFSLWARNRHTQESIFFSFVFIFLIAEFLLVWGYFKMSPIGGSLLFVLIFYFFLENLNIFFRYQFLRSKDLVRICLFLLILGFLVMLVFKPFTIVGF